MTLLDEDPETVSLCCETPDFRINELQIQTIAGQVTSWLGVADYDLHIRFVDDAEIQNLNHTYRAKDRPTDVLSFPQVEWKQGLDLSGDNACQYAQSPFISAMPILGDLVISLPYAARNARALGQSLDREVCFLMVHGILHLCGHDHEVEEDERLMFSLQKSIMTQLESAGTNPAWNDCVTEVRSS